MKVIYRIAIETPKVFIEILIADHKLTYAHHAYHSVNASNDNKKNRW